MGHRARSARHVSNFPRARKRRNRYLLREWEKEEERTRACSHFPPRKDLKITPRCVGRFLLHLVLFGMCGNGTDCGVFGVLKKDNHVRT